MKASELRPNTANTYTPLFLLLQCLKVTLVHISHSFCLKIQPTHTIKPSHSKVCTNITQNSIIDSVSQPRKQIGHLL